jgi:hypothetical protein
VTDRRRLDRRLEVLGLERTSADLTTVIESTLPTRYVVSSGGATGAGYTLRCMST